MQCCSAAVLQSAAPQAAGTAVLSSALQCSAVLCNAGQYSTPRVSKQFLQIFPVLQSRMWVFMICMVLGRAVFLGNAGWCPTASQHIPRMQRWQISIVMPKEEFKYSGSWYNFYDILTDPFVTFSKSYHDCRLQANTRYHPRSWPKSTYYLSSQLKLGVFELKIKAKYWIYEAGTKFYFEITASPLARIAGL